MFHLSFLFVVTFSLLFLSLSFYWIIVLGYRIYLSRKYLEVTARHSNTMEFSNSENNFEKYCHHHQTEIRKYTHMFILNLTEILCIRAYNFSALVDFNYLRFPTMKKSVISELSNCSSVVDPMLMEFQYNLSANPITITLYVLQNIFELSEIFLVLSLMDYLTGRIKGIQCRSRNFKAHVFVTLAILLCIYILAVAWMQFLPLRLITIIQIIYYCYLFKALKRFEYTLIQSAYQRILQFGCNKAELRQYKHFKYTARTMFCGVVMIEFGKLITMLPGTIIAVIFYRKCQFPLNFLPAYNILNTPKQISLLIHILHHIWSIGAVITFLGITIVFAPFFCVTVNIWINQIRKRIRGKREMYRFNRDSLQLPLNG